MSQTSASMQVKHAAAKAEASAGISNLDSVPSGKLPDNGASRNGRAALDTIDSLPSPQPSARPSAANGASPVAQQTSRSTVSDAGGGGGYAHPSPQPMQPARVAMLPVRASANAQQPAGSARRRSSHALQEAPQSQDAVRPAPRSQDAVRPAPLRAHAIETQASVQDLSTPAESLASPYAPTATLTPPASEQAATPSMQRRNGQNGGAPAVSDAQAFRTPGSRRGSALLASVNSHLKRSGAGDRHASMSSPPDAMMDSAASHDTSADTRSKRRFAKFNGLFQKRQSRT